MAITAGQYIIRSALDEDEALAPNGGSTKKNATVILDGFFVGDSRCYWKVTVSSGKNRIQATLKGSYSIYCASATVPAKNVVMQGDYKAATGLWTATQTGTMTVNGATVNTHTLKWGDTNYYLTVKDDNTLYLDTAHGSDENSDQRFYFEASTSYKTMTAPQEITTVDGVTKVKDVTSVVLQWKMASGSSKLPAYEIRYRSLMYDDYGQPADDYLSWTGWNAIQAETQLNEKKKYNGYMKATTAIPLPTVDNDNYSKAKVQVELRLTDAKTYAAYSKATNKHGDSGKVEIMVYATPNLYISSASEGYRALFDPYGLGISYSTNYVASDANLSVTITQGNVTLVKDYLFEGQASEGILYFGADELYATPTANATITVTATLTGGDGFLTRTVMQNLTVVYDENFGLTIAPAYSVTPRQTLAATITAHDVDNCYYQIEDLSGNIIWKPADLVSDGAQRVYEMPAPYGSSHKVLWSCANGVSWASQEDTVELSLSSQFYSWYWYDGEPHMAMVKYKTMDSSDVITLQANKFITTGRDYPVYRYSKSIERNLDFEGKVLDTETDAYCTRADIEAMAKSNHCVFRQPDGKWYEVAIISITQEHGRGYTHVSIGQEAESR